MKNVSRNLLAGETFIGPRRSCRSGDSLRGFNAANIAVLIMSFINPML
jgi:hypothetical protein